MTATVAVLVPVLARPKNVRPLVSSILSSSYKPSFDGLSATLYFLVTKGDVAEELAIYEVQDVWAGLLSSHIIWVSADGEGWAKKINLGHRITKEPWVLCAADDVIFRPGWLAALQPVFDSGFLGVVGTNDLVSESAYGHCCTHPLVSRAYADEYGTVDGPGAICDEGYDHQFVDNEIASLAIARKLWRYERKCVIEHRHWALGKAEDDETYRKGRANGMKDWDRFRLRCEKYGWDFLWTARQTPASAPVLERGGT